MLPRTVGRGGGTGGRWWARAGDKARLRCRVVAAPAPSFRWTVNSTRVILNSHKYFVRSPQVRGPLCYCSSVIVLRRYNETDRRYTITPFLRSILQSLCQTFFRLTYSGGTLTTHFRQVIHRKLVSPSLSPSMHGVYSPCRFLLFTVAGRVGGVGVGARAA